MKNPNNLVHFVHWYRVLYRYFIHPKIPNNTTFGENLCSTEGEELMSETLLAGWQNLSRLELLNGFSVKIKMRWQDFIFLPCF